MAMQDNSMFENASIGHGDLEQEANEPNASQVNQNDNAALNSNNVNNNAQNNISGQNSNVDQSSSINSQNGNDGISGTDSASSANVSNQNGQSGSPNNNEAPNNASMSSTPDQNAVNTTDASNNAIHGAQPSTDSPGVTNNVAGTGGAGNAPGAAAEFSGNSIEGATTEGTNAAANAGRSMAGGVGSGEGVAAAEGAAASTTGAASIGQTISGLVSNAVGAIGHAASSLATTAVSFAQGAIGTLVGTFGAAGTAMAMSAVVGVAGVGGVAVYNAVSDSNQRIDDSLIIDECDVDESDYETMAYQKYSDVDISAQKLENATKIYSVMKAYGWPDELTAGLCGCIECECGFDPTCIEYMESTEPYVFGEQKAALFDKDANGRYNVLPTTGMTNLTYKTISWYNSHGYSISESTYLNGGKPSVGIGLLQWTGSSCYGFLDYCIAQNEDWYGMDVQLEYLISPNGYYRHKFCENPKNYTKYSVTDSSGNYSVDNCADWCEWYITGHANQGDNKRREAAEKWFEKFAEMEYDANYGNSIVEAANAVCDLATTNALKTAAEEECNDDSTNLNADNSNLVAAALSMSWPTRDQAVGNNGTELYQQVLKAVGTATGRSPVYMACSDFTYAAILWSGTDDNFSMPPCASQVVYLKGQENTANATWAYIGKMTTDKDQLQPGDLIISNHHTYIWLGNEAIKEKYPDASSSLDCAMASYLTRSAGLQTSYDTDSKGEVFQIWRCINPTGEASKYTHLLDASVV